MKNRIKELRKKHNFTLDDIQKMTGIKRGTYSNYENGNTEPKIETWQKLADFFGVPVPYLQGYKIYICTRCGSYFIPEPDAIREDIECCPYCMNPYFEGDVLQTFDPD